MLVNMHMPVNQSWTEFRTPLTPAVSILNSDRHVAMHAHDVVQLGRVRFGALSTL